MSDLRCEIWLKVKVSWTSISTSHYSWDDLDQTVRHGSEWLRSASRLRVNQPKPYFPGHQIPMITPLTSWLFPCNQSLSRELILFTTYTPNYIHLHEWTVVILLYDWWSSYNIFHLCAHKQIIIIDINWICSNITLFSLDAYNSAILSQLKWSMQSVWLCLAPMWHSLYWSRVWVGVTESISNDHCSIITGLLPSY